MAVTIDGTTGVSAVQAGAVTSAALASGVPTRAQLPAGSVLQVVSTTTTTQIINNTTSWVSTGLSLAITPSSASSKILAVLNIPVTFGSDGGFIWVGVRLTRAGSQISQTMAGNNIQYIVQQFCPVSLSYLDSPATTSSTTYQVDFSELGVAGRYGNTRVCTNDSGSIMGTLQLLEIAA